MSEAAASSAPKLARHIGLAALVIYGIGDMVGAGIYGTIGVAAGVMGNAVWLAFVLAMLAAMLTGLSYASLASRYPRAAGAAYVTQRAFGFRFLSYLVGLAVAASGLTSMAAGSRVFAANFQPLIGAVPLWCIFLVFIAVLTVINLRGIRECVAVNIVCTLVEVGGLLFVIAVGLPYLGSVNYLETPPAAGGLSLPLIMGGAVLTFYAFVGFEDLLNLAEEVKNPRKTMPWGIILAVGTVTVVYVLVSIVAVSVVPYARLADPANGAPLAQLTSRAAPWLPPGVFTFITLFAVANTALMNFIMGSRLVYGMSRQGLMPAVLGKVHPTRHTPHVAILVLAGIVALLAFAGDIKDLASATSILLLLVFGLMNGSLIVLRRRKGEEPGGFEIPVFVPVLGALVCLGLVATRVFGTAGGVEAVRIAGVMLAGIVILYFVVRPKAEAMAAEIPED
ncbi:MAG TPA: amino acid permease [Chthoniobacterales bacterium]